MNENRPQPPIPKQNIMMNNVPRFGMVPDLTLMREDDSIQWRPDMVIPMYDPAAYESAHGFHSVEHISEKNGSPLTRRGFAHSGSNEVETNKYSAPSAAPTTKDMNMKFIKEGIMNQQPRPQDAMSILEKLELISNTVHKIQDQQIDTESLDNDQIYEVLMNRNDQIQELQNSFEDIISKSSENQRKKVAPCPKCEEREIDQRNQKVAIVQTSFAVDVGTNTDFCMGNMPKLLNKPNPNMQPCNPPPHANINTQLLTPPMLSCIDYGGNRYEPRGISNAPRRRLPFNPAERNMRSVPPSKSPSAFVNFPDHYDAPNQ